MARSATNRAAALNWADIPWHWSNGSIGRVYGVDRQRVARERAALGLPPAENPGKKAGRSPLPGLVLGALFDRAGSLTCEVHERVARQWGSLSKRQVIRVLRKLVRDGAVRQDPADFRYRRIK